MCVLCLRRDRGSHPAVIILVPRPAARARSPPSSRDSTTRTIAAPRMTSGQASLHKPCDRRKGRGGHLLEVAVGELGVVGGIDVVAADGPGVHHHAVASDGAAQTVPHERAQKHSRCHLRPPHPDGAKLHALGYIRQERLREEARAGLSFTPYTSSLLQPSTRLGCPRFKETD
jgi:hypothetical protein